MSAGRTMHFRVGLLILIAAAIFLGALFLLGVFGSPDRPSRYYVRFPGTVIGLRERASEVFYRGVPIGVVTGIMVDSNDPQWITVATDIKRMFRVKQGMTATIIITDLTGIRNIELTGGAPEEPDLRPGDTIEGKKTIFEEIGNVAQEAILRSTEFIENLNSLFPPDAKARFHSTVANIERLSSETLTLPAEAAAGLAELEGLLADSRASLNRTGPVLEETLVALKGVLEGPELDSALADLAGAMQELRALVAEIAGAARDGDLSQGIVDARALTMELTELTRSFNAVLGENRADLQRIVTNLRLSSDNLRELTLQLRVNPSALVRSGPAEERRSR